MLRPGRSDVAVEMEDCRAGPTVVGRSIHRTPVGHGGVLTAWSNGYGWRSCPGVRAIDRLTNRSLTPRRAMLPRSGTTRNEMTRPRSMRKSRAVLREFESCRETRVEGDGLLLEPQSGVHQFADKLG